ncbi:MAG TPA: gliding motility lipoprotein GldH [Bacteroidales bacterium]|jgi:gliding motility-associated lipoprotein GldH|nr:gliding motility lipoprotein GldH [Bacteroidales bacterium]
MIKGTNRLLPLMVILFLAAACIRNVVFTDTADIKGNTWALADIPSFTVPVDDTLSNHDISFLIRTGSSYPFRNIYFFVTTTSPDGQSITDTLQYELADEKGNWYGRGFGDIHELRLPYRNNVFFPMKGDWRIDIQHGMRVGDLRGVYDIGVRVELSQN